MEEKLSIRVNIADKYYPLKINRTEEERIRKAARLINERFFSINKNMPIKMFLIFLQ